MALFIGSDHGGFAMKEVVKKHLAGKNCASVIDVGCFDESRVDYPDIAATLCKKMKEQPEARGILICGTGIGIGIAANKFEGIRCGIVHDNYTAKMTRQHNDANVIAFGGRVIGDEVAKDIVDVFLATPFEGGRHADRIQKITNAEAGKL